MPPQSPSAKISSSSTLIPRPVLGIRHLQTESHISEAIPKDYILKLNKAIEDLHAFEAENNKLMLQNQQIDSQNKELQRLIGQQQH